MGENGTGGPWGLTKWNLKASVQSSLLEGFRPIDGAVQSLAGINQEKSWQVPFNLKTRHLSLTAVNSFVNQLQVYVRLNITRLHIDITG